MSSLSDHSKTALFYLCGIPNGNSYDSEFRKFLSEKLHISSRDINFLKRELLEGGLIFEYVAGSTAAVSLTVLGWEIAKLETKKRKEAEGAFISALARPALGLGSLSRALSDQPNAIAIKNLLGTTEPSDKK